MAKVILLTDNTWSPANSPRAIGAYKIAHELELKGFETVVVDYINDLSRYRTKESGYATPVDKFIGFLEPFITEDVVAIGVSSTFFSPADDDVVGDDTWIREGRSDRFWVPSLIEGMEATGYLFQELRRLCKQKAPKAKILVGGAKAVVYLQWKHFGAPVFPEIDYLAIGPVDYILSDVLTDIINLGQPKTILMEGREVIDTISHYRQPKLCGRHRWQKKWGIQFGESLPLEVSRGCVFNCKFCHFDKQESTRKDLAQLRAELIENYEQYGTTTYLLLDDCFNDHREKVEATCSVFKSLPFKIEWSAYARFDVAVRFPETVRLMVDSGAKGLFWGVESLSENVARRAGKGTPPEKVKQFLIDFYRDYGDRCLSEGSFIVGLPGETRENLMRQIEWVTTTDSLHFASVGALTISRYKAELDKTAIDYGDYARFPEKYGFKEISFDPLYWRHESMDLTEAKELSNYFVKEWLRAKKVPGPYGRSSFSYPGLRSYGLSPSEARELQTTTNGERYQTLVQKTVDGKLELLKKYFTGLRGTAAQVSSPSYRAAP